MRVPPPDRVAARSLDLLSAAHGTGAEALAAWERFRGTVDWQSDLEPGEFGMLPALVRNLRRLDVDDPLLPRLKGVVRQSVVRSGQRMAAWTAALEAPRRAGCSLVLVPPSWTWAVDPSTVMFPGEAFHACVREEEADRAAGALLAAGWAVSGVRMPSAWLAGYLRGAGAVLLQRDGERLRLVRGLPGGLRGPPAEVWSRTVVAEVGGPGVVLLGSTDALEMTLRHAAGRGFLASAEAVLGILAARDDIDVGRLAAAFREMPLLPQSRAALEPLEPWLARAGIRFDHGGVAEPRPTPPASIGHLARARRDWHAYRATWGGHGSLGRALAQLPGFLMGRFGLENPLQLPRGLLGWIRRRPHSLDPSIR